MTRETNPILVIEDDPEIQRFISRVLELEGYSVLQTEDGDAGLRLTRQSQFALVLLDLKLPGRNGWDVLQDFKTDPALSAIPVIVITASAGVNQRNKALSLGALDYLIKPVSAAMLKKACSNVLCQRG